MKNLRLNSSLGLWLLALCLLLTFQSCNKETENVAPAAANAINSDAVYNGTVPPACKTVCLVAGQHNYVGSVNVALAPNGDLLVTYTSTVGISEIHLDAFTSQVQLRAAHKMSGGGAIPGKFAFKQSFSPAVLTVTYAIPADYISALNVNEFFVATHAALVNGETAWGGLCNGDTSPVSLAAADQFDGANWGTFFSFNRSTCGPAVDFTYAWEDRNDAANDADYNDFVVQAKVVRALTQLDLTFTARARGAGYDHKFRFKIAKAGITGVFLGSANITASSVITDPTDPNYYLVTVFESTRVALPGVGPEGFANTVLGYCIAPTTRTITVKYAAAGYAFDSAKPYEPFLTVYPLSFLYGYINYDLYIRTITNRGGTLDTYTLASNGLQYPNGVVIPSDWKWPLEHIAITNSYPNFTSLPGFTANWYTTLAASPSLFVPCP